MGRNDIILQGNTRNKARTATILVFLILGLTILTPIISAANWDNVKSYNAKEEKITIYNWNIIGRLFNIRLAEYTLDYNTDQCLIDCYSGGTAKLYKPGKLFDTLKFKNSIGKETNLKESKIFIEVTTFTEREEEDYDRICTPSKEFIGEEDCIKEVTGSHMITTNDTSLKEYSGEILEAGEYVWRIEGTKGKDERVDWITTAFGKEMNEWAWWDSGWTRRMEVNVSGGYTKLSNFTILLNVSHNISMTTDFDDLRFVDGGCSGIQDTELKYEINNKIDSNYANVWVKIPSLNAGELNDSICMYYGNPTANSGANPKEAWDDFYLGVWHLEEADVPWIDSKGNYNFTVKTNTPNSATGKIGGAVNFDNDECLGSVVGGFYNQMASSGFLIEFWSEADGLVHSDSALGTNYDDLSGWYAILSHSSGRACRMWTGTAMSSAYGTQQAAGSWHYWSSNYDGTNWQNDIDVTTLNFVNAVPDTMTAYNANAYLSLGCNKYNSPDSNMDGRVDEVRISNGTIRTDAWIDRSYNNTNFDLTVYGEVSINEKLVVTLNTPLNNTHTSSGNITFNVSYTFNNMNTTNATFYIYNSTGIFNKTNLSISPAANSTEQVFSSWVVGNYNWNVWVCGIDTSPGVTCSWGSEGNYTFEYIPFSVDSEIHLNSSLETGRETFKINITSASGYSVGNARLIYNGTTYENANKVQIDSDSYALTKTIYIPPVNLNANFNATNVSFYWNVSLINELTGGTAYSTTTNYNQSIYELKFQECSDITNITVINFTLYDEATLNRINATTNATSFQASFNFGAYSGNKLKNYSFGNLSSSNSSFIFCTDNSSRTIYTDMVSIISASGYAERNYYLSNSTLTNATSEISIYLIPENDALEFFISVTQGLRAVPAASVQIAKFFVGEGIYKTIEIDETDSNGEFNIYLDLDRDYQATVIKDGTVLGIKTFKSSCSSAPCEITIEIEGTTTDFFAAINSLYAENVRYNLSYDPTIETVTFQFVDITGLANYFRMAVYNSNSSEDAALISNQTLYTSSGSMFFNASGYDGQFIAEVFVSRSPELPITFLQFMISSFLKNMGDYTGEALLLVFLLILTFIFGLSFKPAILMLAIPIIIHLATISGLLPTSGIVITVFYILAALGVVAIGKGS